MNYDGQTGNFTEGMVVTGDTSGATATIESDTDSGDTGYLTLVNIKGAFQDNETITDSGTGNASVNGTLTRAGKTLAYDGQTANFNVGSILSGQTSGATAYILADSDSGTTGTLTLTDIRGQFVDNETLVDDGGTPGEATCNGTLTDTSSMDVVLTLSKNNGGEYIKISLFNIYPMGSDEFSHNPQEDSMWMDRYPFELYKNGNVEIDVLG